ncbi:MAG: cob(I)yrinic acid a,c-diamide adenosyltransferase [Desulfovibrio sp.]|jgi:cob(I)alamin adenosyltransferase|nr:cob(I)yrinic acid a,c-diamide adenosyltransferase [Desulfovibrio sp.]
MLILYTGNGKGKTSACVGQALRAAGQGMAVAFGQFMKRDNQSGEQRILKRLLGTFFFAGGEGFFRYEKDRARHRAAALNTLAWGKNILSGADMLVLDETLYALNAALLTKGEVANLVETSGMLDRHLVLSGRNAPDWLVQLADIVTEMREIKHPCRDGVAAAPGIEF